ncbi:MAG: hypothetical protein HY963_01850 [Ignavibacteriales bacterium]|nr:hypothetical protein [Ignavibacteriales bacterium]
MKNSVWKIFIFFIFSFNLLAQNNKNVTGFYSGNINKNLAITLTLKQSGNEVKGYYHYNKNKINIRLHGKIYDSGNIELEEYGFFEITGYWHVKLNGDQFAGTWISGDKKRNLPFSCTKILMTSSPGEPMSSNIAFGEKEVAVLKNTATVPRKLAEKLFNQMIEEGQIDLENEYTKDVVKKGKKNPSVLFIGESVDLNNDQEPELVVFPSRLEGACTSQNCPFWIFKKNRDNYQQILYGNAGIFGHRILDVKGNNSYDVALIEHSSTVEHEYNVYRFNGSEYKLFKCITQTAHESKKGGLNYTYKEHNCNNNDADPKTENIFTGSFKDFEVGDYIHNDTITIEMIKSVEIIKKK